MKALLIAPNQRKILSPRHMQGVQKNLGYLPPLGLLSIAGYIREHTKHQIGVVDALLWDLSPDRITELVKKEMPDLVGISAITLNLLDVQDTIEAVKIGNPQAVVVLGGAHVNIFPEESLLLKNVDYIARGEGEKPLSDLLDFLDKRKEGLPEIPGIYSQRSLSFEHFIHEDLDQLSLPARDLTDFTRYHTVTSLRPPTTTLMGSRGCPFHCTFCNTAGGKTVRFRSAEKIASEIKTCVKMGIREFLFFDETFTLNRNRVMDLCRLLIKESPDIYFDVRSRVDLVDREMLNMLRKAGCRRIQFGVESGSHRVLKRLKKGFTPDRALEAFRMAREAGIATYGDFMIGNPGETDEDLQATFKLAKDLNPDYVHFSITMPLPETELYRQALDQGIISGDYWRDFAKDPKPGFEIKYWEENFTAFQLEEMLKKAYRDFYFRPGYIIKSLLKLKSPGELARKAKAGLGLIRDL